MALVWAPRRTCAVSPPAPWHIGIPPRSPDARLPTPHERHTRDGVTRRARSPKYSWARSLTATTAFPKVRGSWGITRSTKAEPKAAAGGSPTSGRANDGPDRSARAASQVTVTPAARMASETR
jgi:hypothetical protein